MGETLGDALPAEIKRVREQVLPGYYAIGDVGKFGLAMINHDLTMAERALASGDVVEMVRSYKTLKETQ